MSDDPVIMRMEDGDAQQMRPTGSKPPTKPYPRASWVKLGQNGDPYGAQNPIWSPLNANRMNHFVLVIVVFAVAIVALLGLVKLLQVLNSPDGERYRKMRMQGPFVPLSEKEIGGNEQRASRP